MSSLKSLAQARLAELRADETRAETAVKHAKQGADILFHPTAPEAGAMKQDLPRETAKNDACFTVSSPRARNSETASLPTDIAAGLDRLKRCVRPARASADAWREVVTDALRLRDDGWAATALALGWEPLHLWGWSRDRDGLAVMLRGRRLILIDDRSAIIDDGRGARACHWPKDMPGARLIWEMSK